MGGNPLDIVIVGGSIAGLMHGISLRRLGHNVTILERSESHIRASQAAGMRSGPQADAFMGRFDLTDKPYCTISEGIKFLDKQNHLKKFIKYELVLTSWSVFYYRLRANFDQFESTFCSVVPNSPPGSGKGDFLIGMDAVAYTYANDKVTIHCDNTLEGTRALFTADLVLAADGGNSKMRSWVVPGLKAPFAGYVAWRGNIIESAVSAETVDLFDRHFTMQRMPNNHIIIYIIPGEDGSLERGKRILNWVWYYNVEEYSPRHQEIMTDVDRHLHRHTVPPGQLSPEVWEQQLSIARSTMAAAFLEVLEKTEKPFVTSVSDYIMPRASFCNGHLLFVGDSFAQFRPHVALSANQAALSALNLEKVVKGEMKLAEWERIMQHNGETTKALSALVGAYSQFGVLEGLKRSIIYGSVLASQFFSDLWWRATGGKVSSSDHDRVVGGYLIGGILATGNK